MKIHLKVKLKSLRNQDNWREKGNCFLWYKKTTPTFVEYRTYVEEVVYRGLLHTQARAHLKFWKENFSHSHWDQLSEDAFLLVPKVRNKVTSCNILRQFHLAAFKSDLFKKKTIKHMII